MADQDPISDEDLQRIWVEPLTLHQGTITLVDSDPNWPILFDREARRIQQVLGPAVVQLEHAAVPDGCSGEANLDTLVPGTPTPGAMRSVRT